MKNTLKSICMTLSRFKTATLLNIVGLSVAFAAFMIILAQVRYELTYDTVYPTYDRLYQIEFHLEEGGQNETYESRPQCEELFSLSPKILLGAYRDDSFSKIAVYDPQQGAASVTNEWEARASEHFPEVFGLKAVRGSFAPFNLPGKAILSLETAQRIFGSGDPIGEQLILNDGLSQDTVEVIAVHENLPRNASVPNGILRSFGDYQLNAWWSENYRPFVLIRSGRDVPEIATLFSDTLKKRYFPNDDAPAFEIVRINPLNDRYFDPQNPDYRKGNRATVYSLIAVAVLILLIAAVNFINFSMALIPRRIRSINTRKVLGSDTLSLRLQQIAEAVCVTLCAFLLAVGLTQWIADSSLSGMIEADMHPGQNLWLVGITLGIACLTGVLAAVYPAFYSTSFSPALALKGSFGLSAKGRRLRTAMIGFQYVTSIALIIVALYVRTQYEYMRTYDIGMNREQIVATKLTQPMARQQKALTQRLKQHPAVEDVAYAKNDVISPEDRMWGVFYQGKHVVLTMLGVTPNFLSMMDIPVVEGRDFSPDDQQRQGVYILNQTACRQYGMQVGERLENYRRRGDAPIVGMAKDFNFKPLYYPIGPAAFYVEHPDSLENMLYTYVKISGHNPAATLQDIRKTLLEFDPNAANILRVDFMDESCGSFYLKESLLTSQITLFSLLAVLISTVGAFGLILFETQYRRKEIGVRKVFGATVGNILGMFNRRYMRIVAVCFVIAAPTAYYAIVEWQSHFLYKAPLPGWIFAAALGLVGLVTVLTVTLQSYRSATENPARSVMNE